MSEQGRWTDLPDRIVGRDKLIGDAVAALVHGVVCLHGVAGVGATTVALAVARRWVQHGRASRMVAVRVAGETTPSELVLKVGLAVGAELPGRTSSVLQTLRDQQVVVLVDDADLAADAVEALLHLAPGIAWVLTARGPLLGRPFEVPALSDDHMRELLGTEESPSHYLGLPGLKLLGSALDARDPWSGADMVLPPVADLLAQLPMGLPATSRLGELSTQIRIEDGRCWLPRCLREALGGGGLPGRDALEAALREAPEHLQAVACDLEHTGADFADAILWRRASENSSGDPDLAALAAGAAARVLLRHFQAAEALNLLVNHLARGEPLLPAARSVLHWVAGDALLAQGEEHEAEERYQTAARDLREAHHNEMLSALLRACAHSWSVRGRESRARAWLAEARATLRDAPDAVARADALRIAADLSARSGELVGASALYDEAFFILSRVVGAERELAAVRLGQAALAMVSGEFVAAEEILSSITRVSEDEPIVSGSIAFRRAELAVRRGRTDSALDFVAEAMRHWRRAGNARGLCLSLRLRGDVRAVAGDRLDAASDFQQAMDLCVSSRDLVGLHRVLRHAVAVEREGIPGAHIEALEQHLETVEVLLRVPR